MKIKEIHFRTEYMALLQMSLQIVRSILIIFKALQYFKFSLFIAHYSIRTLEFLCFSETAFVLGIVIEMIVWCLLLLTGFGIISRLNYLYQLQTGIISFRPSLKTQIWNRRIVSVCCLKPDMCLIWPHDFPWSVWNLYFYYRVTGVDVWLNWLLIFLSLKKEFCFITVVCTQHLKWDDLPVCSLFV